MLLQGKRLVGWCRWRIQAKCFGSMLDGVCCCWWLSLVKFLSEKTGLVSWFCGRIEAFRVTLAISRCELKMCMKSRHPQESVCRKSSSRYWPILQLAIVPFHSDSKLTHELQTAGKSPWSHRQNMAKDFFLLVAGRRKKELACNEKISHSLLLQQNGNPSTRVAPHPACTGPIFLQADLNEWVHEE